MEATGAAGVGIGPGLAGVEAVDFLISRTKRPFDPNRRDAEALSVASTSPLVNEPVRSLAVYSKTGTEDSLRRPDGRLPPCEVGI